MDSEGLGCGFVSDYYEVGEDAEGFLEEGVRGVREHMAKKWLKSAEKLLHNEVGVIYHWPIVSIWKEERVSTYYSAPLSQILRRVKRMDICGFQQRQELHIWKTSSSQLFFFPP